MSQPRRTDALIIISGILFGCAFVLIGTMVEALRQGQLDVAAMVAAQRDTPLLWIIDTAPIVLGIAASFVISPRPLPQAHMHQLVNGGLVVVTLLPFALLLGAIWTVAADQRHFADLETSDNLLSASYRLALRLSRGDGPVLDEDTRSEIEGALRLLAPHYPAEVARASGEWERARSLLAAGEGEGAAAADAWLQASHTLAEAVNQRRLQMGQRMIITLVLGALGLLLALAGGGLLTFRWRATAAALVDSEARFKQLADITIEGVAISINGTIIDANRAFGTLFDYSPVELVGMTAEQCTTPEEGARVRRHIATADEHQYQSVGLRKDGSRFPVEVNARTITVGGEVARVTVIRDISAQVAHAEEVAAYQRELEAANARLSALATTDGLTGAANRRAFDERLAEEVRRTTRYGHPLSLLLLDVDHFKGYNDRYGHPAGDEVLRRMATLLRAVVRETDIVARYGGEEFAVILPNTDAATACTIAERARATVAAAPWPERAITVSIGAASSTHEAVDPELLTTRADVALYQAKAQGRDAWVHFAQRGQPVEA